MEKEVWKPVVGYEGLYEVSNLGRVKSVDRYVPYRRHPQTKTTQLRKGKVCALVKTRNGYLRVLVSKNGKHRLLLVHRLVALAFIPNPLNKEQVNHIDANKENNVVNNLEWCSCYENMKHAHKNGLYSSTEKPVVQLKNGVIIAEFKSQTEAWHKTGILSQCIGKVALGKRKKAGGYQWLFKKEE